MITMLLLAAAQAVPPPPAPPTPPAPRKIETTIIQRVATAEDAARATDEADRRMTRREVRIVTVADGAGKAKTILANCDGGSKFDTEATGTKDGKKVQTRVTVCTKGGSSLEALETAARSIADNDQLPADVRAKVLAELNGEIRDLKAGK